MSISDVIKALLAMGLPSSAKELKVAVLAIEDPIVFAILFGAD